MQSGYHENGQGRPKQDGKTQHHPPPGSCVATNSYRQTSVETDRGGVPPYLVIETLVVNGKLLYIVEQRIQLWRGHRPKLRNSATYLLTTTTVTVRQHVVNYSLN